MESKAKELRSVFTKNRTEELGYDVWKHFVVPPFYDVLDLHAARKPRVILGGRGCGKTMLLRYLSHQSVFSPDRTNITVDALSHVGLYWRIDTQFAKIMVGRGVEADVWDSAFNHFLAIFLGIQVMDSMRSIANSKLAALSVDDLRPLTFKSLKALDLGDSVTFEVLETTLKDKLSEFEVWVANARTKAAPTFFVGQRFLLSLIEEIKQQIEALKDTMFVVYIDEYENLQEYQQRILNTLLKHSEFPLVFNIAIKRNGIKTPRTVGDESITNIADYREHDLEAYMLNRDYPLFAAEILLLNLALAGQTSIPIDVDMLRDPEKLAERKETAYREKVLGTLCEIFPSLTQEHLAREVFTEPALKNKLETRIRGAVVK